MAIDKANKPSRRKAIRLGDYDYTSAGYYFVTVCTHQKQCLFGAIAHGAMLLNQMGSVADECWAAIPDHFVNVSLDEYVVMPNHVHGIVELGRLGGARHASPLHPEKPALLGAVVGSFKAAVSKQLRLLPHMAGSPIWQRNYYEHVIRSEASLRAIRDYIANNPAQWAVDKENPACAKR